MVIDLQDHLFVGMAHPLDSQLHIDAGIPKHDAEGMSEIMRADGPGLPVHEAESIRFFFFTFGKTQSFGFLMNFSI